LWGKVLSTNQRQGGKVIAEPKELIRISALACP